MAYAINKVISERQAAKAAGNSPDALKNIEYFKGRLEELKELNQDGPARGMQQMRIKEQQQAK